jgi:hypothetical protein
LGCLHERKREEERGKLIITRFIPTHSRAEKFSTQNLTNSRLEMRILISPSDACDMRKINNESSDEKDAGDSSTNAGKAEAWPM